MTTIIHLEDMDEHFIVHYDSPSDTTFRHTGSVYFAQKVGDEVLYFNDDGHASTSKEVTKDTKIAFNFNYGWRGVWDDRVYFPNDEEFWGSDLLDMAACWGELTIFLKDLIRKNNPDYEFFED